MSDHKRVGLHRAFSPSGLSAAPGSNIHLAWCIPGLETLMWFVGESRWQVHGSTLLTDSAGASGRVHNNTECFSPPSFPLFSNHIPTTQPSTCTHTHAFSLLISVCWCWEIAGGTIQDADIQLSTISLAISCFPLCSQCFCLSFSASLFRSLRLTVSVYISSVLLHYTHSHSRHTHAHAPWLVPHHPLAPIHSINHSPRSCFFTFSALLYILPPKHVLKYWKFDVLSSLSSVEIMSCNRSKSINIC